MFGLDDIEAICGRAERRMASMNGCHLRRYFARVDERLCNGIHSRMAADWRKRIKEGCLRLLRFGPVGRFS